MGEAMNFLEVILFIISTLLFSLGPTSWAGNEHNANLENNLPEEDLPYSQWNQPAQSHVDRKVLRELIFPRSQDLDSAIYRTDLFNFFEEILERHEIPLDLTLEELRQEISDYFSNLKNDLTSTQLQEKTKRMHFVLSTFIYAIMSKAKKEKMKAQVSIHLLDVINLMLAESMHATSEDKNIQGQLKLTSHLLWDLAKATIISFTSKDRQDQERFRDMVETIISYSNLKSKRIHPNLETQGSNEFKLMASKLFGPTEAIQTRKTYLDAFNFSTLPQNQTRRVLDLNNQCKDPRFILKNAWRDFHSK